MLKFIEIEGKRYSWKGAIKAKPTGSAQQLLLFELQDIRGHSQQTARGRYEEPTLFKVD
jgi:hypothetical protein